MTTRFFTSWVRRGAAAAILEPDPLSGAYAGPATFQPVVTLARDGAPQPPMAGPELPLLDPGAVVSLQSVAVVRTDPAPGAIGVEDNHLVLVELARPDLPWLFTPAKPNRDRLRPWLVLVVVERSAPDAGTPRGTITVSDAELPDLDDSWAWAHVQVTAEDEASVATVLGAPFGGAAVSRLVCPRRLQPDRTYLACIVPSTRAGVRAALGLPVEPGPIEPAWKAGEGNQVTLPVFYSWTFSTGDGGDFESLVRRLRGRRASDTDGFGTRTIDLSAPWQTPPQLGAGTTVELDGALSVEIGKPGLAEPARSAFETRLTALLDFPAAKQPVPANGNRPASAVAPPIYGGRHVGVTTIAPQTGWLRTLNLDPRWRIAAAFGTRYVQQHQEFLMARAWDQLGAVREANRLRATAELAAEVGDRLHFRHFRNFGVSALLSVAAPARSRIFVETAAGTLHAAAAASPLPAGAATVAFSRFARPLGPLGRRAFARNRSTVIEQGLSGKVQSPPPPAQVDGIVAVVNPPNANEIPDDATGVSIARAWSTVSQLDQPTPTNENLTAIREVLRGAILAPAPGVFGAGPPTVIAPPRPKVPADAVEIAKQVIDALAPSAAIFKRLAARSRVSTNLNGGDARRPAMASPEFAAPLALALFQDHPESLLPGLGRFPDDSVTLLHANGAFVEAFLVGANHEMNRELLWREYPTDQRGTPFRRFWPRPDGKEDVPPITKWSLSTELGGNGAAGLVEDMIVMLVRGEILRRYPRTVVLAAPARIDESRKVGLDPDQQWIPPQFLVPIDSRTTAFAYSLTESQVRSNLGAGKAGFYFVFSEPVTAPRFKFDEPSATAPQRWSDLDWGHVPQARGFALGGVALATPPRETTDRRWNRDAADVARIAFARPFRVGYHADELLPPPEQ